MERSLFVISDGSFCIKSINEDKNPAMQSVFIIEADDSDTLEMLEARERFARIRRISVDDVVVNRLAPPE